MGDLVSARAERTAFRFIRATNHSPLATALSYSQHAESRTRRKPRRIKHMIFSTRNTLPCCASHTGRFSLLPCLPASLPRDPRHYGFFNRDMRRLEFRATSEKSPTCKILIETLWPVPISSLQEQSPTTKPAGETPAPQNLLLAFARLRGSGLSLTPCLRASLPRLPAVAGDPRHYDFFKRDIRKVEFLATNPESITCKFLLGTLWPFPIILTPLSAPPQPLPPRPSGDMLARVSGGHHA